MRLFLLVILMLGSVSWGMAEPDGAALSARCKVCHNIAAGAPNKLGPNLWSVVGRGAAEASGYSYSESMKALKGKKKWDETTLDVYLTDPRAMVPGTRMIFPGLKDPAQRKALITWLKTQR